RRPGRSVTSGSFAIERVGAVLDTRNSGAHLCDQSGGLARSIAVFAAGGRRCPAESPQASVGSGCRFIIQEPEFGGLLDFTEKDIRRRGRDTGIGYIGVALGPGSSNVPHQSG